MHSHEAGLEALKRENERLRLIGARDRRLLDIVLEQSPHGVIMSDDQGRLVLQNEAAERIWAGSATAENVTEWSRYRAFHSDGRPYEGQDWAMARCLESREVVGPEEFHIRRFDDTDGWLLGSSAPLVDESGLLLGAVSVFADITDIKQSEAANQRRALEINDDVVQSVSAARMALDLDRMDDVREALTNALVAARRVVNDLLAGDAKDTALRPGGLRRRDPARQE
jgi:PAS domain S-box-containing protein